MHTELTRVNYKQFFFTKERNSSPPIELPHHGGYETSNFVAQILTSYVIEKRDGDFVAQIIKLIKCLSRIFVIVCI